MRLRALLTLPLAAASPEALGSELQAANLSDERLVESLFHCLISPVTYHNVTSLVFHWQDRSSLTKLRELLVKAKIAPRGENQSGSPTQRYPEMDRYWATCNKACDGLDLLTNHVMGFKKHTHTHKPFATPVWRSSAQTSVETSCTVVYHRCAIRACCHFRCCDFFVATLHFRSCFDFVSREPFFSLSDIC